MEKRNKIFKIIGTSLLLLFYFVVTFHIISRDPISLFVKSQTYAFDADKANHLLQAQDILRGNFFLKGWNLTGVTFLTSDLLFYEIGYLIFGLSPAAICFANALMIFWVFLIGLLCVGEEKDRFRCLRVMVYAGVMAIPAPSMLLPLRVHTVAVIFCLIGMYACYYLLQKSKNAQEQKIARFVMFIVFTLGMTGDLLTLLAGIIPCIILCAYPIFWERKKDNLKFYGKNLLALIASIGISVSFDKLYFLIGGANKNAYVTEQQITKLSMLGMKIQRFLSDLQELFGISSKDVFCWDVKTLIRLGSWIVFWGGVCMVVFVLFRYATHKWQNLDLLSVLLSLSCFVLAAAYCLTDLSYQRYITIMPYALMIVLTRNVHRFCKEKVMKVILITFLTAFSILMGISKIQWTSKNCVERPKTSEQILTEFLVENNLTNGYASFWEASIHNVLSEGKVSVRQITICEGGYAKLPWFNKDAWYEEPANFVIVRTKKNNKPQDDAYGLSVEAVSGIFGAFDAIYEVSDFVVLVYDHDLSKRLVNGIPNDILLGK